MTSLINFVSWSQQLVGEILHPGDLAVDLTAGKGRDTYSLAKAVGSEGQVVAFDLQATALEQAMRLLQDHNIFVNNWPAGQAIPKQAGIFLVHSCHSSLGKILQHPAKAIMANLGYLPGGDPMLITRPDSTLAALQQSLHLLVPGGRLAVIVYPGHPGGEDERAVVDKFFRDLPREQWHVLSMRALNHNAAPYLHVAERTPL
ncbi:MAG: class I SAM-dependent methyltransferase [Desulfuromonadales bacterium]